MPIKAILFDFMSTCLDWHTSIISALPSTISRPERTAFALAWRQKYFDLNTLRVQQNLPPQDFDTTLLHALNETLSTTPPSNLQFQITEHLKADLIAAFHHQKPWPDVLPTLQQLKQTHRYELFIHANGSTRLQLDLVSSAELTGMFDMLFSSELLGTIKPAPEAYTKYLDLTRLKPEECVMVAAHAYDLRGAAGVGMRTVYVKRWTGDVLEDRDVVRDENDVFLEGGLKGLVEVVEKLDGKMI